MTIDDVKIIQPNVILQTVHTVLKNTTKKFYKNGIELEKGAIITERRIEKNRGLYERYMEFWSTYPDLYLELLLPSNVHFNLFFYQRLFLRMIMRHGRVCVIAPRAFSKSFISILGMYLMCIFRPGIKLFICAPGKAREIVPCYCEVA